MSREPGMAGATQAALKTQMTPMDGLMPAGARMAGAAEVLRRTCAYAVFQAPPQADKKFSRA